ncbi:MAG: response regulator [Parafilimonas sp.]|nr:response regulator [Parafilimonas sp.]
MKQIIVADDDPAIRDIFQILLKRAGYAVTLYSNGDLLLNGKFEAPDLFILDKQLSGVDGIEVCQYLKHKDSTKNIPVIIVSASPYIAEAARVAGADDFLEKPFGTKALIELMEKHLNKNN